MEKNVSTRRIFLQKGLTLLAVAQTIPTFLDQTVLALNNPLDSSRTQQPTGKDGKILVVVQLSGGNDGLSMVIPYGDDAYYQLRNKIAHPASQVLKIDNYIGLHPNLTGLKSLYDNGDMAIVQGVGYPNPNRSHFRAMDIWQSRPAGTATAQQRLAGPVFRQHVPGVRSARGGGDRGAVAAGDGGGQGFAAEFREAGQLSIQRPGQGGLREAESRGPGADAAAAAETTHGSGPIGFPAPHGDGLRN